MKNTVGAPARGANFFRRDAEISKIQNSLGGGNNLQIAAPRRVGKTSILWYLLDNEIDENIYVYVDTERVDNEQDFYKKLLKEIIKAEPIAQSGRLQSMIKDGLGFFRRIKSLKVMGYGIDFHETEGRDYYEELTDFLSGFEVEDQKKLVLLIDEFPQTILNIVEANDGNTRPAIKFLQSNRELRIHPEISRNVQFIYTGSIGLNHTVASINASAFVNDLNSIEVEPLPPAEARAMVHDLLLDKSITMDEDTIEYLLQKIGWLIPFHIQLAIQEISQLCRTTGVARKEDVDQAFDNMVAVRNNNHFDHYYSRLKSQFKNDAYAYAAAILLRLANEGTLSTSVLYDEAVRYRVEDQYQTILEILVYDGYIHNTGDRTIYQFNSPVLRLWWQRYHSK